jgi:hypothetical protein
MQVKGELQTFGAEGVKWEVRRVGPSYLFDL